MTGKKNNISTLFEWAKTQDKYWSKRIKLSEKKLEQMNKIESIEEFFGYDKK